MQITVLCIGILCGCLILFVCAGGGFRTAAHFLKRKTGNSLTVPEKGIAGSLRVLFFVSAGALVLQQISGDSAVRTLTRNSYGGGSYTEILDAETGEDTIRTELRIEEQMLTEEETADILDEAEKQVRSLVPGSQSAEAVNRSLSLPVSLDDFPVRITWSTSDYTVMDWDGVLKEVPETGAAVTLTAEITLGDETRSVPIELMVYPAELGEEAQFSKAVQESIDAANEDTSDQVILPEEIGGQKIIWKKTETSPAVYLCFFGILFALLYPFAAKRKEEEAAELRVSQMKRDYPGVLSRIVLFMNAGMSLRGTIEKIGALYVRRREAGKPERPGFEEILRIGKEMENGITEEQAYERLGQRAMTAEYRTLSVILNQNLRRGGDELLKVLEREAAEANEMRLKTAKVEGEKTETRLLGPMVVLLGVVMAVMTVPAFFSM
ncbi:MAG: type II secretion system F family protein [Lachnospiraceae bacterium]|nr:type II secretion system F family protein [Lachnospiraceae bacterium]